MSNTFKVIRHNNRRTENHLFNDITALIEDPDAEFVDSFGLPVDDSYFIYNMMIAVENCFNQRAGVKSIGFEIFLEDIGVLDGYNIMEELLAEIGSKYCVVGNTKSKDFGCLISLLVHCTSRIDGSKFLDDNQSLVKMVKYLSQLTGREFKIQNGTFFTGTSADQNCYI